MYRIYMPVDMVLAISHSRMKRDRNRSRLESKVNSETRKNMVDDLVYDKHVSNDSVIEKNKEQSCLEMFRLW